MMRCGVPLFAAMIRISSRTSRRRMASPAAYPDVVPVPQSREDWWPQPTRRRPVALPESYVSMDQRGGWHPRGCYRRVYESLVKSILLFTSLIFSLYWSAYLYKRRRQHSKRHSEGIE